MQLPSREKNNWPAEHMDAVATEQDWSPAEQHADNRE
jgi:hypothetical protein